MTVRSDSRGSSPRRSDAAPSSSAARCGQARPSQHAGHTYWSNTRAKRTGQTCGPNVLVKHAGQTAWSNTRVKRTGQTCGPNILVKHAGQTCPPSAPVDWPQVPVEQAGPDRQPILGRKNRRDQPRRSKNRRPRSPGGPKTYSPDMPARAGARRKRAGPGPASRAAAPDPRAGEGGGGAAERARLRSGQGATGRATGRAGPGP